MSETGNFDQSGNPYVSMSDGAVIRREDVLGYSGDSDMADEDAERRRKIDTIVVSSVAGIGIAALGLAIHRLKKKQ